ncbi:(4Fe-4S)-binding protein [Streptomyces sp. SID3343]|uniref:ferredoxin n=1 Tax=Streptomyces sp. SID3343 TaxID=2690260 RepID=UPI00136A5392|nr:(4Fe-4S)-binding protein [Streptomyces sp. SID3343]MYW00632.1 ferredoxin [Streptomyces sp. SID3343]
MRVVADRDVCVGAGLCVLTAPRIFDQDDDGLVTVLVPAPEAVDRTAARQAAHLCPSGAVRTVE